jgi:membrane-associated phospholipid phosphatase
LTLRAIAAAALVAFAPASALGAEPLEVEVVRDGSITLAAGALAGLISLWADDLTPDTCRFCEPGRFDERGRTALLWRDPERASLASDVLANGVLPAAALAHAVVAAWGDGGARQAGEDLLSISEAVLLSVALNQAVKSGVGRIRPEAWAEGQLEGTNTNRSFYSGHTSFAFSFASAAGTVATIRGYRSAPWVWAVGMSLAAGVGYLRVAGDAHWVTDVLAGAAVGGAIGFAVPWTLHRPRDGKGSAIQLLPAPGGFALRF